MAEGEEVEPGESAEPKKKKAKKKKAEPPKVAKERTADIVVDLKRPYWQLGLTLGMFGLATPFMMNRAQTNARGLIINGLITLDPGQADVFYAVMALLSGLFAFAGAFGLDFYATAKHFRLVVGDHAVTMPQGAPYRLREVEIPYDEITMVELAPPGQPKRMTLHTQNNGQVGLVEMWMPDHFSLRRAAEEIIANVRGRAEPS